MGYGADSAVGASRRVMAAAAAILCALAPLGAGASGLVGPEPAPSIADAPALPTAETPDAPAPSRSRPIGLPPAVGADGQIPAAGSKPSLGTARTVGATVFVIVLIVGSAALLKRLAKAQGGLAGAFGPGGPSPAGVLEILGRYPLTRGQTLVLLRVDRRVLLLSHTTGGKLSRSMGMSTLCEIGDPEDVASILIKTRDAEGESLSAKFRSMLQRFDAVTGEALAEGEAGGVGGSEGKRAATVSKPADEAEILDERAAVFPFARGNESERAARPDDDVFGDLKARLRAIQKGGVR